MSEGEQRPEGGPEEPADPRPRPRFGEYAPADWSWTPPEDDAGPRPAPSPVIPSAEPSPLAPPPAAVTPRPAAGEGQRRRRRDVPVTIALLVLGVIGVAFIISVMQTLPDALATLHQQEGLPAYERGPSVGGILVGGVIAEVVVWVVSALGAWLLIRRERLSFWVPLIGAVLSFIVLLVVAYSLLGADAVLLEHFQQLATTTPTTPA